MALEQQSCCGALTHTYGDAGRRSHHEWCEHATPENTVTQKGDSRPLSCCGALRAVSAQTGLPFHFEGCSRADEATGTIKRPEGAPEPDPAESRRMSVQVEVIIERDLWLPFCRETGINEWARAEGQVRDGEMMSLTEAQAVRIGLLPKHNPSGW